jgi:hypothetical protein
LYRSVGFRGGLNHGLARETLAGTAERACRAILAKDAILSFFDEPQPPAFKIVRRSYSPGVIPVALAIAADWRLRRPAF